MFEAIDVPILKETISISDILHVPTRGGVYVLNFNDKVLYIGRAKNLKDRLWQHIKGDSNTTSFIHSVNIISYVIIDDICDQEIVESIYIKKLNPVFNLGKRENNTEESKIKRLLNSVINSTKLETSDEIDDFLKTKIRKSDENLPTKVLYNEYLKWCNENKTATIFGKIKFNKVIEKITYKKKFRGYPCEKWIGISLVK